MLTNTPVLSRGGVFGHERHISAEFSCCLLPGAEQKRAPSSPSAANTAKQPAIWASKWRFLNRLGSPSEMSHRTGANVLSPKLILSTLQILQTRWEREWFQRRNRALVLSFPWRRSYGLCVAARGCSRRMAKAGATEASRRSITSSSWRRKPIIRHLLRPATVVLESERLSRAAIRRTACRRVQSQLRRYQ